MAGLFPPRAWAREQPAGVEEPAAAEEGLDSALTRPLSIVAPRRLGESDLAVYPLGLGTSAFGWTTDQGVSERILDRFVDHGGTMIDTADDYSGGRAETFIGDWLRRRRVRDDLVVVAGIGRGHEHAGLGPVSMVRAVEAALTRLGTDHLDLLCLNGVDEAVPLEDTLATAEWLIDRGKARYLAVAGYPADRLIEARILAATGVPKIIAVKTKYNLVHRAEFEGGGRIVATAQSLATLPTAPLAGGFLAGRPRAQSAAEVRGRVGEALGRRGNRVLAALDRVAAEHRSTPPTIALAWLLAKRSVVAPVVSVSAPQQVDALMAAAAIRLTRAQMLELDRVSE